MSRHTTETTPFMGLKDFMDEVHVMVDHYDPYGSCMSLWFAIADELYYRGEHIPRHWEYSPGYSNGEPEEGDYCREIASEATTSALQDAGNIMYRWRSRIAYRGEDY